MHMHNEEMPSKENISPVRRYLQIDFLDIFFFAKSPFSTKRLKGKQFVNISDIWTYRTNNWKAIFLNLDWLWNYSWLLGMSIILSQHKVTEVFQNYLPFDLVKLKVELESLKGCFSTIALKLGTHLRKKCNFSRKKGWHQQICRGLRTNICIFWNYCVLLLSFQILNF